MPVWHDSTRRLREDGRLQLVGIIQEQHPDRCRLFMQWKQMDWPVLVDPLNRLEVSAVPLAFLVDEQGIVREQLHNPRTAGPRLTAEFDPVAPPASRTAEAAGEAPRGPADEPAATLRRVAEALFFSEAPRFNDALGMLDEALTSFGENGALHFARGVAYRMRYDSPDRQTGDFAAAVAAWQRALDLNPNQYVWRRRIQQYGPRLEKPYPFYDWVEQARGDIRARGEIPVPLAVEPAGAELAAPVREFASAATQPAEPDPDGRITRDTTPLVLAEVAVVPPRTEPGKAVRVHIVLRPNPGEGGHWNNEGDPLVVWVNPPDGWTASQRWLTAPGAPQPVSGEPRSVEFELRAPGTAEPGLTRVPAYALYGVCDSPTGACLYRRADLNVTIEVVPGR